MAAKTIEETYQKKDLHRHVIDRPEMYIGSIKTTTENLWVYKNGTILKEPVEYNPGFIKIFDEILVNAIDHSVLDSTVTMIKVDVDQSTGEISVYNNGNGIPIVEHKEHKVYIPELIFGNLLTSSSYNDSEQKITGSINGLGSKLTNIYSLEFKVDTVDSVNKLKYTQTFSNNMYTIDKAHITKCSNKSYTKISFKPDYKRFGMKGINDDTYSLLTKRVYDTLACTNKRVTLYFNSQKIKEKSLLEYANIYEIPEGTKFVHDSVDEIINGVLFSWEVVIAPSERYEQVSFVNGVCTTEGGKHVDHVVNQITKKLSALIESKKKVENIKPSYIKDKLFIFIKATIANPKFSSQSKGYLTSNVTTFGWKYIVSDEFISKLYKTSIVDDAVSFTKYKNQKDLAKSSDTVKKQSKLRIPGLEDAHHAGTSKSDKCVLFLTEGLSAKTFAVSGFSVIGKDNYGVFPLRGKLLNVREATQSQIMKNEEIINIKKILGLQHSKVYTDTKSLRYGSINLLVDSDHDGNHIMGLLINMFELWWPELLEIKGFITHMRTPIVKAVKGATVKEFFTELEYNNWKLSTTSKSWNVKYYKGLGTSTSKEAKELFSRMRDLNVVYTSDQSTNDSIKLAFEKKKADSRKDWLQNYSSDLAVENSRMVSYTDFINKELIHFSMYDIIRSIPSLCDGLKPSQRKVLYTCFKRNITSEVKVAQLGASVAEMTAYHHGEQSLQGTIINMAQNYIGSNNCNLLRPCGQFGTRACAGKDAASARYIFTHLQPITFKIFNKLDFDIIDYNKDDDKSIEPVHYIPVVPLILLNGAQGIGTGYSTNIPCYNLKDIIQNMKRHTQGAPMKEMIPWYKGFKGRIKKDTDSSFTTIGVLEKIDGLRIRVSELPINTWTDSYKEFLDNYIDSNPYGIKDYKNGSSEDSVNFELIFNSQDSLKKFTELDSNVVYTTLKLTSSISIRNMHLFNEHGIIKKYNTPNDIIKEFVDIRLRTNGLRKAFLITQFENDLMIFSNKIRFLEEIINDTLVIYKKKSSEINDLLSSRGYSKLDNGYLYLTGLPIHSFSHEKLADLKRKAEDTLASLETIKSKSEVDLLNSDLETLSFNDSS